MLERITIFIPSLVYAGLILLAAWIIARIVRFAVKRTFEMTKLDERLSKQADIGEEGQTSIGESLATAAYWLIFLIFLPAVLSTLGLEGLVVPVQEMVTGILGFVPNILGAGIIFVAGWFIARIVRQIVVNLLRVAGVDRLGERIGLGTTTTQTLSGLLGTVVYALILIPAVIAALNALEIDAISAPATAMLETFLTALPAIFAAAVVLVLAYFVGRLIVGLVTDILTGIGFNEWPARLGIKYQPAEGQRTPAEVVGYLAMLAIMLFAAIEAAELLGFTILAEMLANFVSLAGQILLGLVIFAIGIYLANAARSMILSTAGRYSATFANLARLAIIVLVSAMALRQFGIANEIVNLAFGILLGAIGIAAALAFGLGSREIAGRQVEQWFRELGSADSSEEG